MRMGCCNEETSFLYQGCYLYYTFHGYDTSLTVVRRRDSSTTSWGGVMCSFPSEKSVGLTLTPNPSSLRGWKMVNSYSRKNTLVEDGSFSDSSSIFDF